VGLVFGRGRKIEQGRVRQLTIPPEGRS
jgi:hypothetical protein